LRSYVVKGGEFVTEEGCCFQLNNFAIISTGNITEAVTSFPILPNFDLRPFLGGWRPNDGTLFFFAKKNDLPTLAC
jgi:hypothetical protein